VLFLPTASRFFPSILSTFQSDTPVIFQAGCSPLVAHHHI
jgi:hypothetical protein